MSDVIEWVLEMRVNEGQAENVQPLIEEMAEATKAAEPGALHYKYYLSEDGTACTVLERYADNAAAMLHLKNFGEKFADRFMTVFAPQRFSVYGPSQEDLRGALSPMGATFMPFAAGFRR